MNYTAQLKAGNQPDETDAPDARTGQPASSGDCFRPADSCPNRHGNQIGQTRMQRVADCRIQASLDHMLRHINEPLRISTLSALAGVSDSHFFSLFKCATGSSPMRFFIRLRMRRACELLAGTTLSLKEVAALLGYGDPFYFSRVFKFVNGVAPRDYRIRAPEFKDALRKAAWPWKPGGGEETRGTTAERRHLHDVPPAGRMALARPDGWIAAE